VAGIEWRYDSKIFDNADIRLLYRFYLEDKLPRSEWEYITRNCSNLDFMCNANYDDGGHVQLSYVGKLILLAYLEENYDPMTAIFKKEVFEKTASMICRGPENDRRRRERTGVSHGYCFAFADMDNLKQFNSIYGHATTDMVLKKLAKTINMEMLDIPGSMCARRSGDEFWIMFKAGNREDAQNLLDSLCDTIKQITVPEVKKEISCTIAAVFVGKGMQADWHRCESIMEKLHKEMKQKQKGIAHVSQYDVT
jgi:diguanylate cyclase (GGDEF)-like protein